MTSLDIVILGIVSVTVINLGIREKSTESKDKSSRAISELCRRLQGKNK